MGREGYALRVTKEEVSDVLNVAAAFWCLSNR